LVAVEAFAIRIQVRLKLLSFYCFISWYVPILPRLSFLSCS